MSHFSSVASVGLSLQQLVQLMREEKKKTLTLLVLFIWPGMFVEWLTKNMEKYTRAKSLTNENQDLVYNKYELGTF